MKPRPNTYWFTADANSNCPIEVLAQEAPVEQLALTQLKTTAHTLPGIIHAVGQPDLCPGTKYPVGACFVSRKWIHPPLIGSDIGCGMAWYKTKLSRNHVDGDKGRKIAEKLRGLEGPWRTQTDRKQWLQDDLGSFSAGEEWDRSLGTIGAGNHFAEVQVVESISLSTTDNPGLHENDVVLLVHSGSRGYGGSILKKYASESHISLEEDSAQMEEYMKEHDQALRWAKANRDLIALRFLSCLEPGEEAWEIGQNTLDSRGMTIEDSYVTSLAKSKIQERKIVDIWHNNLERVKWPPTPHTPAPFISNLDQQMSKLSIAASEDHIGHVYVHRKGAAPTYDPSTNQPLQMLPLPGSRGTPTLIMKPTFSEANAWGLKNAFSLAHGSGRSMSRAKALSSLSHKYKSQNILEPKAGEGTWIICDEKDLVFEEAPEAYKDVYDVGQDLVREGVAEVVGWCKARVSYKVRHEVR